MDIIGWFTGNISWLVTLGAGAVLAICLDRIILWVIQTFWPSAWLRDLAKDLNKKLEEMKAKYPEAGKKLEANVVTDLKWSADYIEKN